MDGLHVNVPIPLQHVWTCDGHHTFTTVRCWLEPRSSGSPSTGPTRPTAVGADTNR